MYDNDKNNNKRHQDFQGTYSFDDGKSKDQKVSSAPYTPSSPKKELILTHDSYLKTEGDEDALKALKLCDIHPYIYVKSPSPKSKENPYSPFGEEIKKEAGAFSIHKMGRREAEIRLSREKEGSFLLRESESMVSIRFSLGPHLRHPVLLLHFLIILKKFFIFITFDLF